MIDKVKAFCLNNTFDTEVELPDEFQSKEFFKCFLAVICEDENIESGKQMRIIEVLRNEILAMGLKYADLIDEWAIANVVLYQRMSSSSIIENDLAHFMKFITFVSIMSRNINQTNQIVSNLLTILNNAIDYILKQIGNYELMTCFSLIELNITLTTAIKAFNPSLISQLTLLAQSVSKKKSEGLSIEKEGSHEVALKQNICDAITVLLDNYKDDINIDLLFSRIMLVLPSLINNNQSIKALVERIEVLYKSYANKAKRKKLFRMNYLIIKPKPLVLLEPDYDLSFLGDHPEYLNQSEKKKEMEKVMKNKIKEKKKQVIRKLKHEAKVIDSERQKELDFIDKKKKEDLRITNQFIEQQNIDYKKLMTSNEKKRFKFKKNKSNK